MAKSIYSFLKVMKDKLYQKTIDYSKNDWESVKRIEKTHLSMIDNLYYIHHRDLSFAIQPTLWKIDKLKDICKNAEQSN